MNNFPSDFLEFCSKIFGIYLRKWPTNRKKFECDQRITFNNKSKKTQSQWIITWKLPTNISENSSETFHIVWYSQNWYVDWYLYWCQSVAFIDFLHYLFFLLVFVLISIENHIDNNIRNRKRQISSNLSLTWLHSQLHRSFSFIRWRIGRFYWSSLLSAFRNDKNKFV